MMSRAAEANLIGKMKNQPQSAYLDAIAAIVSSTVSVLLQQRVSTMRTARSGIAKAAMNGIPYKVALSP